MSNDLISRNAVIDVIKRHECDTSRIMERVMELPAAYDVDKVVEQLEEKARGSWGYPSVMEFDDVTRIVKSGGIE